MSQNPCLDEIKINEIKRLKRKFYNNELTIKKNNQQFLLRDIKNQKVLICLHGTEQNVYDKNDNLSTYNTAPTSTAYFENPKTDGSVISKLYL